MLRRVHHLSLRRNTSNIPHCLNNRSNFRINPVITRKYFAEDSDQGEKPKADLLQYIHAENEQKLRKKVDIEEKLPSFPDFHIDTDSDEPSNYYDDYNPSAKVVNEETKKKLMEFIKSIKKDVTTEESKELFEDEDREIEIDEQAKPKLKDYDSEKVEDAAWNFVENEYFDKKFPFPRDEELTKEEEAIHKEENPEEAFLENVEKQEESLFKLIASREFRDIDKMILAIFTECAEEPIRAWR